MTYPVESHRKDRLDRDASGSSADRRRRLTATGDPSDTLIIRLVALANPMVTPDFMIERNEWRYPTRSGCYC